MTANPEPALAAPGAGLPLPELFIAKLLFAWKRRRSTLEGRTAVFVREREAIRALVESCPAARCGERVLIPRLRGMEDSSRHWSVWMTLDHLRITNTSFARVITALTHDRVPQGRASTADVKPSTAAEASVLADYEASCDAVLAAIAKAPSWPAQPRFAHPWFGPLDAAGWHGLAGTHMGIHRAQLAAITNTFGV